MARAISLLYHDVVGAGRYDASGFCSPDADLYKLDEGQFTQHLAAIGRRVSPGPALFTFDDGGARSLWIGNALALRGWRGCFFIPTNYIGHECFVSHDDIRALAAQGHLIGSHSCSHPARMSALPRERLLAEWMESKRTLERILDSEVFAASIPGGYYSALVAETAVEAGYRDLYTSEPVAGTWHVKGMRVHGRYSVRRTTAAEEVAAIAAGDLTPRMRQQLYWNFKKILKRAGGEYWLRFRRTYLRARQRASVT